MAIRVACSCGEYVHAGGELAGKRIKCSVCGNRIVLPGEPTATQPANFSGPEATKPNPSTLSGGDEASEDEILEVLLGPRAERKPKVPPGTKQNRQQAGASSASERVLLPPDLLPRRRRWLWLLMAGGCVVLVLFCLSWWWLGRSVDYPVSESELSLDEQWQVDFFADGTNLWDGGILQTKNGREFPAWDGTDGKLTRLVYKKEGLWRDARNGEPVTVFLVVRRSGLSPQTAKDIIQIESGESRSRAQIKTRADWKAALEAVEDNKEGRDGWRKLVLGELIQSVALAEDRVIYLAKEGRLQEITVGNDGALRKRIR